MILADGFLNKLNEILKNGVDHFYIDNSLEILIRLYQFGTEQTKSELIKTIPLELIK